MHPQSSRMEQPLATPLTEASHPLVPDAGGDANAIAVHAAVSAANTGQSRETAQVTVVSGWFRDISKSLRAANGWRLVGKFMIVLGGSWGLLMTLQTIHGASKQEQLRQCEAEFDRLAEDLNSPLQWRRVAALKRVSKDYRMRADPDPEVPILDALVASIGVRSRGSPIFAERVRELLTNYTEEARTGDRPLSSAEVRALLAAFGEIGAKAWLEPTAETELNSADIAWIWMDDPGGRTADAASVRDILAGVQIEGAQFVDRQLPGMRLPQSRLHGVTFQRTNLDGAVFHDTVVQDSVLALTHANNLDLRRAKFVGSTVQESSFRGTIAPFVQFDSCMMINVSFCSLGSTRSDMSGATFQNVVMTSVDFSGAILDGAVWSSSEGNSSAVYAGATVCTFAGARMRSANLRSINAQESSFARADLEGADLRDANLQYCQFNGAVIDRVDMRGANLSNALGITGTRTKDGVTRIASCANANIASTKGLTSADRDELLRMGAVEISADAAWQRYKQASYPRDRLGEFVEAASGGKGAELDR